jgi:hypothetical protein
VAAGEDLDDVPVLGPHHHLAVVVFALAERVRLFPRRFDGPRIAAELAELGGEVVVIRGVGQPVQPRARRLLEVFST